MVICGTSTTDIMIVICPENLLTILLDGVLGLAMVAVMMVLDGVV